MGAQASSPAECNGRQRVRYIARNKLRRHLGRPWERRTWERRRPRLRKATDGREFVISRDVRRETCQALPEYAAWDEARCIPQAGTPALPGGGRNMYGNFRKEKKL